MTDDSRRATYRHLADEIRHAIRSGDYAPGSKLPTDAELAERHSTNRGTVGQALRLLEAEGLVAKSRKGTFVSPIVNKILRDGTARYMRPNRETGEARGAFEAELRALGMTPRHSTSITRVVPTEQIAELLAVAQDAVSVVSRARVMLAGDMPVQLATSYLPLEIAEGTRLEELDTGPGGTKSRLADLGYPQATITENIDVRPPTPEEAKGLELAEDQRVYELIHLARTAEGRVVEVAVHVMPTHLWSLSYSWDLGPTH